MTRSGKYKTILYVAAAAIAATAADGERQIITAPVTVQSGDTLSIKAGSELLFTNFTGITVKRGGFLSARGTKEQPVVFTSVNDTVGAAAPFDWNGIEIDSGGGAALSHCLIANATSGVTAADSGGLALSQCIFSNNGQWHLSVAGVTQLVPDDMRPYDYAPQQAAAPPELVIPPIDVTAATDIAKPKPPKNPRKQLASWALGGAGAAAAVAGVAFLLQASNNNNADVAESNKNRDVIPGGAPNDVTQNTPPQGQTTQQCQCPENKRGIAKAAGWTFLGLAVVDGIFLTFLLF